MIKSQSKFNNLEKWSRKQKIKFNKAITIEKNVKIWTNWTKERPWSQAGQGLEI